MKEYLLLRLAQILIKVFPLKFGYWCGLRIADGFFFTDAKGRDAVMSNIRRIMNARGIDPSRKALHLMARKTFQNFGKYLVDFFRFERISEHQVHELFSFENMEHLEHAIAMGKGVIVVTAHFGNWEMGGAVVSAMGKKVNAVVLPQATSRTNELFQNQRRQRGIKVLALGNAAIGSIRALRRNEIVAMLSDRDFTPHNFTIEFFGKPARMPIGPARIAVKTGSPIVPAFLIRQPDDSFLLRFYDPIVPGPDVSVDLIREKVRDIMEKEIAQTPTQWFIFEDFWKEAPAP